MTGIQSLQTPARGLNIQLNSACSDLKMIWEKKPTSPKLDSADWGMLESKGNIIKDLSKTQKELVSIARLENEKLLNHRTSQRPVSSHISPLASMASSPISHHRRHRSLLSEDITFFEDDMTCVDSDADTSLEYSSSNLERSSNTSVACDGLIYAESSQLPQRECDTYEGFRMIYKGSTILISSALNKSESHRSLTASLILLTAIVIVCVCWLQ